MTRIRELVSAVSRAYPHDRFFHNFEATCKEIPAKRKAYRTYDDAMRLLDEGSWNVLRDKALRHFRDHRRGQLKQGFFNQLNEAFAYRHLIRQGFRSVRLLPEGTGIQPDLQYVAGNRLMHCEVKTLGISDEEIDRRGSSRVHVNTHVRLGDGFFRKLATSIDVARRQIASQETEGLVYLVVVWDDIALDYY